MDVLKIVDSIHASPKRKLHLSPQSPDEVDSFLEKFDVLKIQWRDKTGNGGVMIYTDPDKLFSKITEDADEYHLVREEEGYESISDVTYDHDEDHDEDQRFVKEMIILLRRKSDGRHGEVEFEYWFNYGNPPVMRLDVFYAHPPKEGFGPFAVCYMMRHVKGYALKPHTARLGPGYAFWHKMDTIGCITSEARRA